MEVANNVRRLRGSVSARELSRQAGLAEGYIALLEAGNIKNVSARVLFKIAKALGVTVDELLTDSGEQVKL